ncbi:MAG: YHYH protein [Planctomycetota bacterium]
MPKPLHAALLLSGLLASPALAHPGHDSETTTGQTATTSQINGRLASEVEIEVRGGYRYITSNGIPDHEPGRFPNRGNPNRITEQSYRYRMPASPEANDEPTAMRGVIGVALNGVPMDPGTAEFWDPDGRNSRSRDRSSGWNYDALSGKINLGLDDSNAHVQPTGAYHYHGLPVGLIKLRQEAQTEPAMVLVGYAGDGFPMYASVAHEDAEAADSPLVPMKPSYRLKEGDRPGGNNAPGGRYDGTFVQDWEYVAGLGDLDECNGRFGVTPEYPDGTYYYMLTDSYPFIPRYYRGTPDRSFIRRSPGGADNAGDRPRGPRDAGPRQGPPPGERPDGPPPRR